MDIALICERLHVLPNEGGVFQQEPSHILKLNIVFGQIDQYRHEELEKQTSGDNR